MKTIDLHVHSSFSDGTITPTELVSMAKEQQLSAIALTDHDTIDGVEELMLAGAKQGIETISGIELSCSYKTKEIHIVGLYIDYKDAYLNEALNNLRYIRKQRNLAIIEKFKEYNINISYDEMLDLYGNAVITRAHFADYLYSKKLVSSRQECFNRYLNDNGPCYIPRDKMSPRQTIELIKNTGGFAVLAHPTLYHLGNNEMNNLISYLCRSGLDGIEAIYSTYTMGDELAIRKLAKENHLIISGGSDYHGANKPNISLGTGKGKLCIPYDVLDNIKTSLGIPKNIA